MIQSRRTTQYSPFARKWIEMWRIWFFLLILLIAFLFVLYAYFQIQIVRGAELAKSAESQYIRRNTDEDRGTIYFTTKTGDIISAAVQQERYKVAIIPKNIKTNERAIELYNLLAEITEMDRDDFIKKALTDDPYEEIAHGLFKEDINFLKEDPVKEVGVYSDRVRTYPAGKTAAHVLGFVAYDDSGDRGGRYGLEEFYDEELSRERTSSHVNIFAEVFADLKVLISDDHFEGDIITTIEPTVQKEVEKQIARAVGVWDAREAGGIIINPQNGEIIAMVALPDFDVNNFSDYSPESFRNPFSTKVFEMGSIMKPLVMAIGFDQGAVGPETRFYDPGFIKVGKHTIHNFDERGRGDVTMTEVLQQSLNTGMVTVMQHLKHDTVRKYFADLGVGKRTGIDLPSELSGLTSNLDSNRDIEFANISFGQGVALTPIAIVRALSMLANGGYDVTPHLAREIVYVNGLRDAPFAADIVRTDETPRVFKESTVDDISRILVGVVDKELQNGEKSMERYNIAAKTGTAQIPSPDGGYYGDRHLHTFFGYFPAYQPDFLIFLFLNEPKNVKYSSQTLFDPFMEITKFLISYYNIPPDR